MRGQGLGNRRRGRRNRRTCENKILRGGGTVSRWPRGNSRRVFNTLVTTYSQLANSPGLIHLKRMPCVCDCRCSSRAHVFFCNCVRASPHATRKKVLFHAHARVRTAVVCLLTAAIVSQSQEVEVRCEIPEFSQRETKRRRYREALQTAEFWQRSDHRVNIRNSWGAS